MRLSHLTASLLILVSGLALALNGPFTLNLSELIAALNRGS